MRKLEKQFQELGKFLTEVCIQAKEKAGYWLCLLAPNKSHNQLHNAVNTVKFLFYEKQSINLC